MNWTKTLEEEVQKLASHHKNIRTQNVLVSLLRNLDRIPIEKIEALIEQPVIEPEIYQYDIFIDKVWIPIADNMIPNMGKVPAMIEKGLMRKHIRNHGKRI